MYTENFINALSNEFFDNLKEQSRLTKENEELNKKKDKAKRKKASLLLELKKLQEDNATLRKDVELFDTKGRFVGMSW